MPGEGRGVGFMPAFRQPPHRMSYAEGVRVGIVGSGLNRRVRAIVGASLGDEVVRGAHIVYDLASILETEGRAGSTNDSRPLADALHLRATHALRDTAAQANRFVMHRQGYRVYDRSSDR